MKVRELFAKYRWPMYLSGLLGLPIVANGVLVFVATRPDTPRPLPGYYEAAEAWDADQAVEEASRRLGWSVRYELPAGVPHTPGMPRPVDVTVVDRSGRGVGGLAGRLVAIRPADARLNQQGTLVALPEHPGAYRTLVRLDEPGAWEVRLDAAQGAQRFVHGARLTVAPDEGVQGGGSR